MIKNVRTQKEAVILVNKYHEHPNNNLKYINF